MRSTLRKMDDWDIILIGVFEVLGILGLGIWLEYRHR